MGDIDCGCCDVFGPGVGLGSTVGFDPGAASTGSSRLLPITQSGDCLISDVAIGIPRRCDCYATCDMVLMVLSWCIVSMLSMDLVLLLSRVVEVLPASAVGIMLLLIPTPCITF